MKGMSAKERTRLLKTIKSDLRRGARITKAFQRYHSQWTDKSVSDDFKAPTTVKETNTLIVEVEKGFEAWLSTLK